NSIIHRDLKPENLLLDSKGDIKIIDFGFGNTFHRDRTLDTYCGYVVSFTGDEGFLMLKSYISSPFYAAPEMVKGTPYTGPEVDIWSMGVILYALLTGRLPFDSKDMATLYSLISKGEYAALSVSSAAENLIQTMLTVNPQERAKMQEIIDHPWTNVGYSRKVNSFVRPRPAVVTSPDPEAVNELVTYGISEREIRRLLSIDCGLHPIKSLYFLVEDLLERQRRGHVETSLKSRMFFDQGSISTMPSTFANPYSSVGAHQGSLSQGQGYPAFVNQFMERQQGPFIAQSLTPTADFLSSLTPQLQALQPQLQSLPPQIPIPSQSLPIQLEQQQTFYNHDSLPVPIYDPTPRSSYHSQIRPLPIPQFDEKNSPALFEKSLALPEHAHAIQPAGLVEPAGLPDDDLMSRRNVSSRYARGGGEDLGWAMKWTSSSSQKGRTVSATNSDGSGYHSSHDVMNEERAETPQERIMKFFSRGSRRTSKASNEKTR
ncbi:hypothetical protein HDU76_007993, partial [Blyttiomyces sp. JEL0837]